MYLQVSEKVVYGFTSRMLLIPKYPNTITFWTFS